MRPLWLLVLALACATPSPPTEDSGEDAPADAAGDADSGLPDGGTEDAAGDAGSDTGTEDGAGDGATAVPNSGDCDAEHPCAEGACVELTAGGYRVCAVVPPEATSCPHEEGLDACCSTAECTEGGVCHVTPLFPVCAGIPPPERNVCATDDCATDDDCGANRACVPAGAFGFKVRGCLYATCRLDTDCTREAGGVCAPVPHPCCGGVKRLTCVYPSDGCRNNQGCPQSSYCDIDVDHARCFSGHAPCPA